MCMCFLLVDYMLNTWVMSDRRALRGNITRSFCDVCVFFLHFILLNKLDVSQLGRPWSGPSERVATEISMHHKMQNIPLKEMYLYQIVRPD